MINMLEDENRQSEIHQTPGQRWPQADRNMKGVAIAKNDKLCSCVNISNMYILGTNVSICIVF